MRACCFLFESAPSLLMNCGWCVQSGSVVGCVRVLLTWLIHVCGVESRIEGLQCHPGKVAAMFVWCRRHVFWCPKY